MPFPSRCSSPSCLSSTEPLLPLLYYCCYPATTVAAASTNFLRPLSCCQSFPVAIGADRWLYLLVCGSLVLAIAVPFMSCACLVLPLAAVESLDSLIEAFSDIEWFFPTLAWESFITVVESEPIGYNEYKGPSPNPSATRCEGPGLMHTNPERIENRNRSGLRIHTRQLKPITPHGPLHKRGQSGWTKLITPHGSSKREDKVDGPSPLKLLGSFTSDDKVNWAKPIKPHGPFASEDKVNRAKPISPVGLISCGFIAQFHFDSFRFRN
ncbi:hypothetical protein CRG98_004435 [Punica granatum]|uniref:Uncharacterized protein n=1 Tax=Punica granatum TaxID=22663 RepID=A0A2I0L3B3_PUNGR|nr:hypothetical protein CRG98_004435 [Punica granatum]